MSDGPHRSLPMRRAWKNVAELADNANFDVQDVLAAISEALVQDAQKEVPADFVRLIHAQFIEGEKELFPDQRAHDLSNAQRLVDGLPLGSLLFTCAVQELLNGNAGEQGVSEAMQSALDDRAWRGARQIEEHYLRHPRSSKKRAINIRGRLAHAISQLSIEKTAQQALQGKASRLQKTIRHQGLDEGVPLND